MNFTNHSRPQVTIGVPVYNGEAHLPRALESLLAQGFGDFELILSDNCSTDETAAVAAHYAVLDRRVRVIRQPQNIGAVGNFGYVLKEARASWFMWAAADDRWHPDFVEANLEVLRTRPEVVGCISQVKMAIPPAKSPSYIGTFPLTGSYPQRLRTYLAEPGLNSRFYGLFRTSALQRAYVHSSFAAADWATLVRVLRFGDFQEVDAELMERSSEGESSHLHRNRRLRLCGPDSAIPLAGFTRWLWHELPSTLFASVLPQVLEQNARFTYAALAQR
jgi:glycosyltransferase involved in cell wall biosynthesis